MFKEGGKKGVEIEGAADMSGLTCFCTRIQNAKGEVKTPRSRHGRDERDSRPIRRGGKKRVLREDLQNYNLRKRRERTNRDGGVRRRRDEGQAEREGLVARRVRFGFGWWASGGTVDEGATDTWATVTCKEDKEKFFFLKMKDNCLGAAIAYLRERDLFQDDSSSEEGDNPAADFEW